MAWTALGVLGSVAFTLYDLHGTSDTLGGLVVARDDHESAPIVRAELGDQAVLSSGGHDGSWFYVIARDPWHPREVSTSLDVPRYRLQRIAFPAFSWLLHPTGGGDGLVIAMFVVGVAALVVGGLATGALSATLDGPTWPAAVAPVLVGAVVSLRLSVADQLSVALAVAAIVVVLRARLGWAILLGVLAVLAKETVALVLVGVALWKRDRAGALFAAIPVGVALAWAGVLGLLIDRQGSGTPNFDLPFVGLIDSVRFWAKGYEPLGLVAVGLGVVAAVVALAKRRLRHPLGWAVALQLGFFVVLSVNVLGPERNGSRTVLPATVLALVMLVTPRGARVDPKRVPLRAAGTGP